MSALTNIFCSLLQGAIRELRKDSHFLSREKLKESRERYTRTSFREASVMHSQSCFVLVALVSILALCCVCPVQRR